MLTKREVLSEREGTQINPVTLAFVGDAVFSLYVRERLTLELGGKTSDLQRVSTKAVSAQGQSAFLDKLFPLFTETEADVFRRAKNAKKTTKSKSASHLEYSRSTGFEAVVGFLYLTGQTERIRTLFAEIDPEFFESVVTVKPFKPIR